MSPHRQLSPEELDYAALKRAPERDISRHGLRYLTEVDVDLAALEERWGGPWSVYNSLADCVRFA
ncbi:hypothetical protein ACF1BR_03750 [Streptomyces rubiginosohelvolus]|uniref:hypothetical protein n=1 Tax=Streptomyces rubiginosohelvolus TaxID=67362 RepID=UPI003701C554